MGWATKNRLPTLFAESLNILMSTAGPVSTIIVTVSSFIGVIFGGILSDRRVQKNIRGRVYTSAIGLSLTIPSLIFLGFGHSLVAVVGAALLFGIGCGMFDSNNMPILCQFVPAKLRATAYGFMNMVGVFAGAGVTSGLKKNDRRWRPWTGFCSTVWYCSSGFAAANSNAQTQTAEY